MPESDNKQPQPPPPPAPPPDAKASDQKPQTVTVKVDGVERAMTMDELTKAAEKSLGADKRFEDAASLRKEAQSGIRMKELMTSVNKGQRLNVQEATELASLIGGKPEDYLSAASGDDDQDSDDQLDDDNAAKKSKKAPAAPPPAPAPVKMEDLPVEVQNAVQAQMREDLARTYNDMKSTVFETVDKDSGFATMVKGMGSDEQRARMELIKEIVLEDVERKILERQPFGPELIRDSIQRMRARIAKFGTPSTGGEGSVNTAVSAILAGFGPSGGLSSSEIASEKPIERKSISDPGYADNFAARFFQKYVKKMGGK